MSKLNREDKAAFPSDQLDINGSCPGETPPVFRQHLGMTYREWLIGKALGGLMANTEVCDSELVKTSDDMLDGLIAMTAVDMADCVIEAIERKDRQIAEIKRSRASDETQGS